LLGCQRPAASRSGGGAQLGPSAPAGVLYAAAVWLGPARGGPAGVAPGAAARARPGRWPAGEPHHPRLRHRDGPPRRRLRLGQQLRSGQ
nr:hypothetical protein [Tanacetum cinerariifolium]